MKNINIASKNRGVNDLFVDDLKNDYLRYLTELRHGGRLFPEHSKQALEFSSETFSLREKELLAVSIAHTTIVNLQCTVGVEPEKESFPLKCIHVLPEEKFKQLDPDARHAFANLYKQQIILNARFVRESAVMFADACFHEMQHLIGAKTKFEIIQHPDNESDKPRYRLVLSQTGPEIISRTGNVPEHEYREGLGLLEAILASTEHIFIKNLLASDGFKQERKWLQSTKAIALKRDIARKAKIPIDDIYWVAEESGRWGAIGYSFHRELLNYVCEMISKSNSGSFMNKEDVWKKFLTLFYTGDSQEITKLMESTFGQNSYDIIAMMDGDKESVLRVKKLLEKMLGNRERG